MASCGFRCLRLPGRFWGLSFGGVLGVWHGLKGRGFEGSRLGGWVKRHFRAQSVGGLGPF